VSFNKHVIEAICPSYGIAYAKFTQTQGAESNTQVNPNSETFEFTPIESLFTKFYNTIFYIKEEEDSTAF